MTVTFCGHRDCYTPSLKPQLYDLLEKIIINDHATDFYLGGYGFFDGTCYGVLTELQKKYKYIKRIFVTPYLDPAYSKLKFAADDYDETVYPFEEKVIPKFAIIKRNEWMVDNSDYLIAYVSSRYGGAYQMLKYAVRRHKPFINLGILTFNAPKPKND